MRIFRGFDNLPVVKNPVVVIGSFDGVHKGHRLLISQLQELASKTNGESVVVTFDPHPRQVLKESNRLLSTLDEKLTLLAETDIDNVIVVNFTLEFSKTNHSEFIEKYIIEKLGAKILITGQEHNFGHNRGGDLTSLEKYGIETHRFERFENISSTQIRTAIENGKMRQASELLGGQGYLIRTPIKDQTKLLPPDGIYYADIAGRKLEIEIKNRDLPNIEQNIIVMYEI